MIQHNHQTASTRFAEANGIRFAYRRFGNTGGASLVFSQHFRGTMDYWDPAVTDGLARNHEVGVVQTDMLNFDKTDAGRTELLACRL